MAPTLLKYLENFRRHGSDIAYVHRRGYRTLRWSYRETVERASQFARELQERGIGRGDRVMIWGEDSAEWVAGFLGCLLRGAVVVPMDRIGSAEFTMRVARQVDARLTLCSRELSSQSIGPVIVLEDLTASIAHHSRAPYQGEDLKQNDTVEIVFTSGTTADPKGVVISHRNILANIEPLETEIAKYLKYERFFHPLRFLNLLPLSHVFGQFLGIFIPQLLGATVVFQDSLNPSEIIRTIKRERVSVLVAVPRLLEALKDKIERDFEAERKLEFFRQEFAKAEKEHFARRWWRFRRIHNAFGWKFWALISGGAALDAETERFWGRLSFVVIQGYGLTETTALVTVNHPMRLGKGSIGKALPGLEIKLASNGEILVRGHNVAEGYYQGKELRPVLGHEEWFHTGDIGELDADGNLYFKGRQKDVIVTPEGMNIYPDDLEAVLRRDPAVRDCVVFGLRREGNAEPCAVLLLSGTCENPERIIKTANESLAGFQQLRRWFVWPEDDFPRTSTQKPRKNVIEQAAQSRLEGNQDVPAPAGGLADLIGRITGRHVDHLSPQSKLVEDLNLSSMERVALLGALEDRFQVDLNESRFSSATTVGDLEQMLHKPVFRKTDYRYPRWAQRLPVALLRLIFYYLVTQPLTLLMAWPRVRGRENIRGQQGPLLFVCNHVTQVDVVFVMAALPFRYRHRLAVAMLGELLKEMRKPSETSGFMKSLKDKVSYGLVVALFDVFPLPQQTGFRQSFVFAGESADRGYSILVFPEGERTQTGGLASFKSGIGLLANNLNLPIVPVRIDGLFELKRRGVKFARPAAVTVTVGSPVRFEPSMDPEQIARELERRIMGLRNTNGTM